MNSEFTIDINDNQTKVYMQIGFFSHENISYPLHTHIFIEMHIFLNGTAILKCDKEDVQINTGDVLIVPANTPHQYYSIEKGAKRITFLIDYDTPCTLHKTTIPKTLLTLLCNEIQNYVLTGRNSKLKALLSYICSDFFVTPKKQTVPPITNRELIIEEFFSKKYNLNVSIDDLASELMLSKKQTAREVKKFTGNTFTGELSKRKINAAIILSRTTNLSLTQISEKVGYSSYSGFYKAYKNAKIDVKNKKYNGM